MSAPTKWKQKLHTKASESVNAHNRADLPLKMLISHSLKSPYLHYKHCSQTPEKKGKGETRDTSKLLFFIHQRCAALRCCLPRGAKQDISYKDAALHLVFTFLPWVSHTDSGCDHENTDPGGTCFCGFYNRKKCKPNRTTINIQKALVLLALLTRISSRSLYLTETPGVHIITHVLQRVRVAANKEVISSMRKWWRGTRLKTTFIQIAALQSWDGLWFHNKNVLERSNM